MLKKPINNKGICPYPLRRTQQRAKQMPCVFYRLPNERKTRSKCFRHALIQRGQRGDVPGQCSGQGLCQPPAPVCALCAGGVDAGLAAQMQPVCQRDDGGVRNTGKACADNDVFAVVTTDDPKFDTLENVNRDIIEGITANGGRYIEINVRKEAIRYAVTHAKKGDFIFLLGKGEENFLKLKGNEKTPYSERDTLKEVLESL